MAKKNSKHKSFQLSAHGQRQDMAMLYIVMAALIGLAIGWFLRDELISLISGVSGY